MDSSKVKIFYSYSHRDKEHRENMEKYLTLLRQSDLIDEWSDKEILAGQNIDKEISDALCSAKIIVFLVSIDFLNSPACIKEWTTANQIAAEGGQKLISIILRECPWQDFSSMKESLVLPYDGKPVTTWESVDAAWNNVYQSIKKVIQKIVD